MEGHADIYPGRLTERPRLLAALAIAAAALVGLGFLIGGAGDGAPEREEPAVTEADLASVQATLEESEAEVALLTERVADLQARLDARASERPSPSTSDNRQGPGNARKQTGDKRKDGGRGGSRRDSTQGAG
jgi:hypothetical protein